MPLTPEVMPVPVETQPPAVAGSGAVGAVACAVAARATPTPSATAPAVQVRISDGRCIRLPLGGSGSTPPSAPQGGRAKTKGRAGSPPETTPESPTRQGAPMQNGR